MLVLTRQNIPIKGHNYGQTGQIRSTLEMTNTFVILYSFLMPQHKQDNCGLRRKAMDECLIN